MKMTMVNSGLKGLKRHKNTQTVPTPFGHPPPPQSNISGGNPGRGSCKANFTDINPSFNPWSAEILLYKPWLSSNPYAAGTV